MISGDHYSIVEWNKPVVVNPPDDFFKSETPYSHQQVVVGQSQYANIRYEEPSKKNRVFKTNIPLPQSDAAWETYVLRPGSDL